MPQSGGGGGSLRDIRRHSRCFTHFLHTKKWDGDHRKRRKDAELTQKALAERSGVKLRTIQQYEMRAKNINKAAAETLLQLAQVLYCNIEDLVEYNVIAN